MAVGIYGLAYRLFDLAISLPTFFANSAFPLLLKQEKLGSLALKSRKLLIFLFILGVTVSLLGWIFGPWVLSWFGNYEDSIVPLQLLLLGVPIFYLTALQVWLVVSVGKEKLLPWVFGGVTLINIALNLYFVPKFGINAASLITIFAEFLIFACLSWIIWPDLTHENR